METSRRSVLKAGAFAGAATLVPVAALREQRATAAAPGLPADPFMLGVASGDPIPDELVLAGGDQPGHRYPLDPAVWLATACRIAGRDLTRGEWRTYLPDRPYRRTCLEILGG